MKNSFICPFSLSRNVVLTSFVISLRFQSFLATFALPTVYMSFDGRLGIIYKNDYKKCVRKKTEKFYRNAFRNAISRINGCRTVDQIKVGTIKSNVDGVKFPCVCWSER